MKNRGTLCVVLQPSLFPETKTRFEAWLEFHQANPAVWEQFVRFARQVRSRGIARFGARAIWERLRWYFAFEVHYYARLLMLRYPTEFEGFFSTRDSRFDIDPGTLLREADRVERQRTVSVCGGQA